MAKMVREYTFEGPVEWLDKVVRKSLVEGKNIMGEGKTITIKTIFNESNWEFAKDRDNIKINKNNS